MNLGPGLINRASTSIFRRLIEALLGLIQAKCPATSHDKIRKNEWCGWQPANDAAKEPRVIVIAMDVDLPCAWDSTPKTSSCWTPAIDPCFFGASIGWFRYQVLINYQWTILYWLVFPSMWFPYFPSLGGTAIPSESKTRPHIILGRDAAFAWSKCFERGTQTGVSKNRDTPESSNSNHFLVINHPF